MTRKTLMSSNPDDHGDTLSRPALVGLWGLVCGVLAVGMVSPDLMGGDAAQDAVMAMRMFRDGDWLHLVREGQPYLDKPHLLFWSAMAAYQVFGVHDWAYRLASVLVTLLGAWSTGRLAARLAGRRAGQVAALVFATAQAVVLSAHDVRMDALLTGFTAAALWQLTAWIEEGRGRAALLGGLALGLAVASKGMVGPAVAVPALLAFAWGRGVLGTRLRDPRLGLVLLGFALALAPVLYAYYVQFDLHPELVVGGRTGRSGVAFILFGQSLERFSGGHGTSAGGDYAFFFHTLLWAFLPWTALLLDAWWTRLRALLRGGLAAVRSASAGPPAGELLTFPWPLVFICLLNLSRFKLPQYLNVTFPLLAAGVALHLEGLLAGGRARRLAVLAGVQAGVVALLVAVSAVLNGWAFPLAEAWIGGVALLLLGALGAAFRAPGRIARIVLPSAVAAVLVDFLLAASFFPQLAGYHPGSAFVERGRRSGVDWARTFQLGESLQPVRIYAREPVPTVGLDEVGRELASGKPVYLVVGDEGRRALDQAALPYRTVTETPACRITMINARLLSPAARDQACRTVRLVQVGERGATTAVPAAAGAR